MDPADELDAAIDEAMKGENAFTSFYTALKETKVCPPGGLTAISTLTFKVSSLLSFE
jgi:hypothetical protein